MELPHTAFQSVHPESLLFSSNVPPAPAVKAVTASFCLPFLGRSSKGAWQQCSLPGRRVRFRGRRGWKGGVAKSMSSALLNNRLWGGSLWGKCSTAQMASLHSPLSLGGGGKGLPQSWQPQKVSSRSTPACLPTAVRLAWAVLGSSSPE